MKSSSPKKEKPVGKTSRASARQPSAPAHLASGRTSVSRAPRKLAFEQLEPRLLLSADGLGIAPELALPGAPPDFTVAAIAAPQTGDSTTAAVTSSRELVFVDQIGRAHV